MQEIQEITHEQKNCILALLALLCITTLLVFSQTSSQFPELDKNGRPLLPRPMPHLVYSPTDLAHSGVALPASVGGATPNTSIIRVGDATKMTVFASCTQNFDLVMSVYIADDQGQSNPNFILYNSYIIATDMASGAQQAYLATRTCSHCHQWHPGAPVRLPQLAVSFFEKNDVATAGTCTDRVIVGY